LSPDRERVSCRKVSLDVQLRRVTVAVDCAQLRILKFDPRRNGVPFPLHSEAYCAAENLASLVVEASRS
jgi:hypothetical protein